MKWLSTFNLIVRSSITTLWEKIEDPERLLQQLLIDMEEELDRARDGVAEAIADEIQLGRQVEKAREDSRQWFERAQKALEKKEEERAKSALERKVAADRLFESLSEEHLEQKKQTERLQKSVRDLEGKIRQARQKRTLLVARMARAESTKRINCALDHATNPSAFAEFSRLERKVERSEALADAYDRLAGRDPADEELEAEFEERDREERVDAELVELKKRFEEEDESKGE